MAAMKLGDKAEMVAKRLRVEAMEERRLTVSDVVHETLSWGPWAALAMIITLSAVYAYVHWF